METLLLPWAASSGAGQASNENDEKFWDSLVLEGREGSMVYVLLVYLMLKITAEAQVSRCLVKVHEKCSSTPLLPSLTNSAQGRNTFH